MHRTPPRPQLFTDSAIPRRIYLEYIDENSVPVVIELTGTALDQTTIDILNNPTAKACVIVKLSPNDQANAPLVYQYFIKKFRIDYHQDERVLEVRLKLWSKSEQTVRPQVVRPVKVFAQGYVTIFARISIELFTIYANQTGTYEISSSASLNHLTGIISL